MSTSSYLEQLKEARAYIARLELELEGYQRQISAVDDLYHIAPDQVVHELIGLSTRSQEEIEGLDDDFDLNNNLGFESRRRARETQQEQRQAESDEDLVEDLRDELTRAQHYVQQLAFENEGLKRQIAEAADNLAALIAEKSALEQDIDFLEEAQGEMVTERVTLESALISADQDLKKANAEVDRLSSRIAQQQAQVIALAREANEANGRIGILEREVVVAAAALADAKAGIQTQRSSFETQLSESSIRLRNAEEEASRLTAQVNEMESSAKRDSGPSRMRLGVAIAVVTGILGMAIWVLFTNLSFGTFGWGSIAGTAFDSDLGPAGSVPADSTPTPDVSPAIEATAAGALGMLPSAVASDTRTITDTPTQTASPTSTFTPTNTATPTITPTPTPTPLAYATIAWKYDNLSDEEWDAWRAEVIGKRVQWRATVSKIDWLGNVFLDVGQDNWTRVVRIDAKEAESITTPLVEGDVIQIDAVISDLKWQLGFVVWLMDPILQNAGGNQGSSLSP